MDMRCRRPGCHWRGRRPWRQRRRAAWRPRELISPQSHPSNPPTLAPSPSAPLAGTPWTQLQARRDVGEQALVGKQGGAGLGWAGRQTAGSAWDERPGQLLHPPPPPSRLCCSACAGSMARGCRGQCPGRAPSELLAAMPQGCRGSFCGCWMRGARAEEQWRRSSQFSSVLISSLTSSIAVSAARCSSSCWGFKRSCRAGCGQGRRAVRGGVPPVHGRTRSLLACRANAPATGFARNPAACCRPGPQQGSMAAVLTCRDPGGRAPGGGWATAKRAGAAGPRAH